MALSAAKTVITCAVTGNLTTREQTPHLPVTPAEIAQSCLEAGKRGPRLSIFTSAIRRRAARPWNWTIIAR